MTNDRFNQLVNLLMQNRRYLKSVYQPIDNKMKKEGMIIVEVYDTSSIELCELIKAGFGFSIFSAGTSGYIEIWFYDIYDSSYEQ